MKFVHTADVHLGAKFEMLGERGRQHREQIRRTFTKITDLAIKEKADLFLVAGDLFDSNNPSLENINFAKEQFHKLTKEDIRVCLIPGNHDFEIGNTKKLGKEFSDMQNVFLFTNPDGSKQYFEDINTEVYAKANNTNKSAESPIPQTDSEHPAAFKIIMAHGGVTGQAKNPQWPIKPEEIENSGADYIALGDWHSLREETKGNTTAFYSGSPEMISLNQVQSGHIITGAFDGIKFKVDSVKVGARNVRREDVNVSEFENLQQLKESISALADEGLILLVNLSGVNSNKIVFNTEELEDALQDKFWHLQIKDNSKLPIEQLNKKDYPPVMISGQFLQLMKEKIKNTKDKKEKHLLKEALHTGLLAFEDPDVIS